MFLARRAFEYFNFHIFFIPFIIYYVILLYEISRILWYKYYYECYTIYYPQDTKIIFIDLFVTYPRRCAFNLFYNNFYNGQIFNFNSIIKLFWNIILVLMIGFPINIIKFIYNLYYMPIVWSWLTISPYINRCIIIYKSKIYINMKRNIVEIVAYKEMNNYCNNNHVKGLFMTGNFKHGGVYNKNLDIGGYYSTKNTYLNMQFLYEHDHNYFYKLEKPSSKLYTVKIYNSKIRELLDLYSDYDLMRCINHPNIYNKLDIEKYYEIKKESYNFYRKLLTIHENILIDRKYINIYKNDKNLQKSIELYKEYNFEGIDKIIDKLDEII